MDEIHQVRRDAAHEGEGTIPRGTARQPAHRALVGSLSFFLENDTNF